MKYIKFDQLQRKIRMMIAVTYTTAVKIKPPTDCLKEESTVITDSQYKEFSTPNFKTNEETRSTQ